MAGKCPFHFKITVIPKITYTSNLFSSRVYVPSGPHHTRHSITLTDCVTRARAVWKSARVAVRKVTTQNVGTPVWLQLTTKDLENYRSL
eukprot:6411459-Pyramimonas_sp.AAC.1